MAVRGICILRQVNVGNVVVSFDIYVYVNIYVCIYIYIHSICCRVVVLCLDVFQSILLL
jgi:hypothetical protein